MNPMLPFATLLITSAATPPAQGGERNDCTVQARAEVRACFRAIASFRPTQPPPLCLRPTRDSCVIRTNVSASR